jgi:two-component system, OmpR family, copper resistance phosphate regulon response regulator CusR
MHILIIEDEVKLAHLLKDGLEEEGYKIDLAFDGISGKETAIKGNYDLIIIDVLLPGINGLEVCKRVRAENPFIPIIMLTALGTTDDKLNGFDSGADDYILKPFEFRELLARIKAQTKKNQQNKKTLELKVIDLVLKPDSKTCIRGGKEFKLTVKEYALLEYLIKNKNRVISRKELAEKIWNIKFDTGTNTVDVYVNYLRRKIDKDFDEKIIETHFGVGYIIKDTENGN